MHNISVYWKGLQYSYLPFSIYIFIIENILYHGFKIYKKLSVGMNPWVNYIHLFIIGPLLLYIGLNREKTERRYFEILLMLGFASIGYHGYYLIE